MTTFPGLRVVQFSLLVGLSLAGAIRSVGDDAVAAEDAASLAKARDRASVLRLEISRADELYFKQAAPDISDAAYDRLKRDLAELEHRYPELASIAGPAGVGDDRAGDFPAGRHREPMLSLRKSYSEGELRGFHERVMKKLGQVDASFVIEPKFDGLAISVTYRNGECVSAVTRGNGAQGDDVTANVVRFTSLPRRLRAFVADGAANVMPELIELRGEIYVSFAEFARINAEQETAGEELYSQPRNLAAGTLKLRDPAQIGRRQLDVVFYGVGACEPAAARPGSQRALHAAIRDWGLPGVQGYGVAQGAGEIWAEVGRIGRDRGGYAYPTDGAVVKLDDVALQRELGNGSDAPNWAMAFKFSPEQAVTQLRAITVQVGRTGVLTPIAELVPVRINGSLITRASLHNFAEIARRDIRVGDFVFVEKAGEIIPAIAGVDRTRRAAGVERYEVPTVCPACAGVVVQMRGETAVRCPAFSCPAQLRRRLAHFAGKSGVEIDGMGPATIDALVGTGAVKNVADLFRLTPDAAKVLRGNAAERLISSIERSKRAELWRFVHGLGIPGIGPVAAKGLAKRFGGLAEFAEAGREAYFDNGASVISGVSPAAAEAALAFFSQPRNRELVTALLEAGVRPVAN